ncbi:MAG: sialate O-acetylesterase [Blastopirellula sp.]|nr:MAG: sialate O-acetylesterase [Blastopirellula sp.]
MVIQRDAPIHVWGNALPDQQVTIGFSTQTASTKSDQSGHWKILLKPLPANKAGQLLKVSTSNSGLTLNNVVIGDVWHASGQSNMAMTVAAVAQRLPEAAQHIREANLPNIRFRRVTQPASKVALDQLPTNRGWVVCSPKTVSQFSAVSFYYAKELSEQLDVPIGIIDSSRGGTPIEPYIPRKAFHSHPTLMQELKLSDQNDLAGLWKLKGGVRARTETWLPGQLFNSRIAPIADFQVRGMIWYQGESNSGTGEDPRDYQYKMRALVDGWRTELKQPQLPCYFVQLPGSGAGKNWPYLREQQRLSASIPNTAMVVTIDLLDQNIHPPNKVDVSRRLASCALANEYKKNVPYSGPLFKQAQRFADKLIVHFNHTESGLMAAKKEGLLPPKELATDSLAHFELLDPSGNWHAAKAEIDNQTVIVSSGQVSEPVAVRYAYEIDPQNCQLYNRDGFPASPFCSQPAQLDFEHSVPEE